MMKKYHPEKTFMLFILLFIPAGVNAIPLGSVMINSYCPDYGSDSSVIFYTSLSSDRLSYGVDGVGVWFPHPAFEPFFIKNITLGDIGNTFAINGSNYTYWDNMLNYVLADGTQDLIDHNFGWVDPMKPAEWDFSQYYAGNGIDFEGYIVDNLLLTIGDLKIVGVNLQGYSWAASWTLTVDGQPVPEPATFFLLGAGALGFACFRKKLFSTK